MSTALRAITPDSLYQRYKNQPRQRNQEPAPEKDFRTRFVFSACESPIAADPESLAEYDEVYPAGALDIPTKAVASGKVPRGIVTPFEQWKIFMMAEMIPDGMADPDNKEAVTMPTGVEIRALLAGPSAKQGLVEITALIGWEPLDVAELRLTAVFFPTWPVLPELLVHRAGQDELASMEGQINAGLRRLSEAGEAQYDLYEKIASDMIRSCRQADTHLRQEVIAVSENAREVPSTDNRFKATYDTRDLLGFRRTGVQPAKRSAGENQPMVVKVEGNQSSDVASLIEVTKQLIADGKRKDELLEQAYLQNAELAENVNRLLEAKPDQKQITEATAQNNPKNKPQGNNQK